MRATVAVMSVVVVLVGGLAGTALALNMETVPVGNPGNAGELSGQSAVGPTTDPYGFDRVCGAVGYAYRIGKFEVTAGQYCDFLNAVAKTDTYGLYDQAMDVAVWYYACNIKRAGSSGSHSYSVPSDWANRPVNLVSWGSAARFCNWLTNGQPTGAQDSSTTEDGSYYINGATTDAALLAVTRKPQARYVIPTEDEWYKAAYYDPNRPGGPGYWDYPTRSEAAPSNVLDPTGTNNANFYRGDYTIGPPYYRTQVGAFANSPSPYGTFDQGGNLSEWTEEVLLDSYRGLRGGCFLSFYYQDHAAYRNHASTPARRLNTLGFRIVEVPEPASAVLLVMGGVLVVVRRVRRFDVTIVPAVLAVAFLSVASARANVFDMPPGLTSLEMVTVGNPGNAGDTRYPSGGISSFGGVGYTYGIGKYEVTAEQYTEFLNKMATTDTYGLYNTYMADLANHGCNIQRSGSSGSYTYSVAADWANRPVTYVGWGDAARFCNWLANGQPTGAQDLSTTEDGAYFLNGATSNTALQAVTRKANATWVIPTEDEWYKAAYYKGGSTNAGYWDYPTSSNTAPGRDLDDVSGNNANCGYSPLPYPIDPPHYTTVVGEFQNSDGPYGTFDQGGNVWEWNEAVTSGSYRGLRGGSFYTFDHPYAPRASYRGSNDPAFESSLIGFRVVQVPEPATLLLLALGVLCRITALSGVHRW